MNIDNFITQLSIAETAPDATNQYAPGNPDNAIRRDNLRTYLTIMQARQPATLMVMEAPGYRGCRLTGVPVTSRKILLEGLPGVGIFGTQRGYTNPQDSGFERIRGEQSATIVWNALADLAPGHAPLIWNTFPFHPHKPDQPLTNRRPRKPEMTQGTDFLRHLLTIFAPRTIIAVGNVAHETLTGMDLDCTKVRHPAQGGKHDFIAGMRAILTDNTATGDADS